MCSHTWLQHGMRPLLIPFCSSCSANTAVLTPAPSVVLIDIFVPSVFASDLALLAAEALDVACHNDLIVSV